MPGLSRHQLKLYARREPALLRVDFAAPGVELRRAMGPGCCAVYVDQAATLKCR